MRLCTWLDELAADAVFANADYEPYALKRDQRVKQHCCSKAASCCCSRITLFLRRTRSFPASGTPFSVYTPYKNAWLKACDEA